MITKSTKTLPVNPLKKNIYDTQYSKIAIKIYCKLDNVQLHNVLYSSLYMQTY